MNSRDWLTKTTEEKSVVILNSPIRLVKKKIIGKEIRHWVRPGRNNIW